MWFVARKKELIVRGGSNISPVEKEQALLDRIGGCGGDAIRAVDPHDVLRRSVSPEQLAGCVVYFTSRIAPSGVALTGHPRLVLGAIEASCTGCVRSVADVLGAAGVPTEVSAHIRRDIGTKVALT